MINKNNIVSYKLSSCAFISTLFNRLQVLREGKGQDSRPDRGQVVTLQVAGRTEDGTAVDWNRSLEFILGDGEVIQGSLYTV